MNPRIEELRQRLDREPGSRLFAQLGEELRKDGDIAGAIKVCRDGLARHPAYPSAHITLGRALMDSGDLGAARGEFETVLKGAPDNILASRYLGECLEALGDIQGAIAQFRVTLALAPGDRTFASKIESLEARLKTPHPGKPIPLVDADDSFEIEGPELQSATLAPTSVRLEPSEEPHRAVLESAQAEPFEFAPALEPPPPARAHEGTSAPEVAPLPEEAPVDSFSETVPPSRFFVPTETEREAVFDFGSPSEPEPAPVVAEPEGVPEPEVVHVPEESPAPAAASFALAPEANLSTPTLAELYFNQGFADKAIEVYKDLLGREPGNARAAARLAEIEALHPAAPEAAPRDIPAPPPPAAPAPEPPRRAAPEPVPSADPRARRRHEIEQTIARLEQLRLRLRRA